MNAKAHAQAVKDAVDKACKGGKLASPGARIEEILGVPLPNYPDEIMPLDLLPTVDGLKFIGWTPDFIPVEMEQAGIGVMDGKTTACIQVAIEGQPNADFIVGWKPIRRAALTVVIAPEGTLIDGYFRKTVNDTIARRAANRRRPRGFSPGHD